MIPHDFAAQILESCHLSPPDSQGLRQLPSERGLDHHWYEPPSRAATCFLGQLKGAGLLTKVLQAVPDPRPQGQGLQHEAVCKAWIDNRLKG